MIIYNVSDSIEGNIDETYTQVETGRAELQKAETLQVILQTLFVHYEREILNLHIAVCMYVLHSPSTGRDFFVYLEVVSSS